ncbi:hypothetical protein C8Q73DRAFT_444108 [Cubamyces lactineus]|nr:hypothetical protein C8Q73DRAFT_444108 [Cubamyces lactineus]
MSSLGTATNSHRTDIQSMIMTTRRSTRIAASDINFSLIPLSRRQRPVTRYVPHASVRGSSRRALCHFLPRPKRREVYLLTRRANTATPAHFGVVARAHRLVVTMRSTLTFGGPSSRGCP